MEAVFLAQLLLERRVERARLAEPVLERLRHLLHLLHALLHVALLLRERLRESTPEWAAAITGIPAARIRALARELGTVARDHKITLPIAWTDSWGRKHDSVTGNPVAFHAMRGLAAHSNGFQTVRALAVLMSVLGTIDAPLPLAMRVRGFGSELEPCYIVRARSLDQ